MAGVYSIQFNNKVATAAMADFDFFELAPAADRPIEVIAIFIGNESQESDANEDFVRYSIRRFTASFASGGEASATAIKMDVNQPTAGTTCESFNAVGTVATGTSEIIHTDTFNVRTGLQIIFPPELRPRCAGPAADDAIVVRCDSTLDASTTFSGTLYFKEL